MRRLLLVISVLAAVAAPAGAQPDGGWQRHVGEGFSLALPSTWADASNERARLLREMRRLAGSDPQLADLFDDLMSASSGSVAVKMIAFDLARPSLRSGFATNLTVVRERTPLPLAIWRDESIKALMRLDFVVKPIWWRMVKLPAGKAVRLTYRARFQLGTRTLETSITQYALVKRGAATVVTYTTLPKLAKGYAATFERSARSLRLD